jgi:hypothetical protein
MDDFDGRFIITAPLWVAVDRRALRHDPNTGSCVIDDALGILSDGRNVVFFTDQDLAERFVEARDKVNLVAACLNSPDTLVRILEDLEKAGYEGAAFDPALDARQAHGSPISELLKVLREQPPARDDPHE